MAWELQSVMPTPSLHVLRFRTTQREIKYEKK